MSANVQKQAEQFLEIYYFFCQRILNYRHDSSKIEEIILYSGMRTIKIVLQALFILNLVFCFTQRTKCSSNMLTFSKRFIAFYINIIEASLPSDTINYYQFLNSNIAFHYGYPYKYVPTGVQSQNFCKNFFTSENNCCSSSDINQLQSAFLSQYSILYAKNATKYPSFMLLYEFQNFLKARSCGANFQLPGINGYTYLNASLFGQIVKQHDILLEKIRTIQKQYLTDSVCILCTGAQSYKHFLYPTEKDRINQQYRKFVINTKYFQQKTKNLAQLLMQFSKLHDNMVSKVLSIANSINQSTCLTELNKYTNINSWNNLKICSQNDYQKCLQFAVDYFGDAGAPQYSRMFQIKYKGGLLPNRGQIYLSNQSGYRGNVNYRNFSGDKTGKSVIEYANYTDIVKMFL